MFSSHLVFVCERESGRLEVEVQATEALARRLLRREARYGEGRDTALKGAAQSR